MSEIFFKFLKINFGEHTFAHEIRNIKNLYNMKDFSAFSGNDKNNWRFFRIECVLSSKLNMRRIK